MKLKFKRYIYCVQTYRTVHGPLVWNLFNYTWSSVIKEDPIIKQCFKTKNDRRNTIVFDYQSKP